jgi:hypothetical protein
MRTALFEISQKEINQRSDWLIATIASFGLCPLLAITSFAKLSENTDLFNNIWYQLAASTFGSLVSFWLIWHCAYKKPGTKLLTSCLILAPIDALLLALNLFQEPWNIWNTVVNVINASIFLWWYIQCIKLKRINKKIQLQSHPEYVESLQLLKGQTSRESLDHEFFKLIRTWPQFERTSSKEYKLKKAELSHKAY